MSEEIQLQRGRDPTDDTSQIPPQISSAIDKILANPDIISTVASALGGSGIGNKKPSETTESDGDSGSVSVSKSASDSAESTAELIATLAPILSTLQGKSLSKPSPHHDRRACLLNALKPYLCRERCEAIDYMIKLGRISELLKNII